MKFNTDYQTIIEKIEKINPFKYGHTRNYIDGDITYLSPYISRGFISSKQVLESLLKHENDYAKLEKFVQQLVWREYFQRIWESKGEAINEDLKEQQQQVHNHGVAKAITTHQTGIVALDKAVMELYETGYIHNHSRMYLASLACNVAKSYWKMPAKWMYYNLLDADWASNTCSWQWVAGSFSTKKYYANQNNINRYTRSFQEQTFLDYSYEDLVNIAVPKRISEIETLDFQTVLPISENFELDKSKATLLYNAYNLDVLWHQGEDFNRVLLLEPSHFEKYPMCAKTIDFILALAKNIEGIQLFCGEFAELKIKQDTANFVYKYHPAFLHYEGTGEERDWIFAEVSGYYPSFFSYWRKCESYFRKMI